jgi:quinol monooxygenase YgiN
MSLEGPRLTRDLPPELGPKQEGEHHDEDAPDPVSPREWVTARAGQEEAKRGAYLWSSSHYTSPSSPSSAKSYLAGCVSVVEQARGTAGCVDFAITADLIDPGRVNIFERRESQATVETFRSSGPSNEQGAGMHSASVAEYDIADVRPVFGEHTA